MNHSLTYLRLFGATLFWAGIFHIGKYAVQVMSPLSISAWRFVIAGLILVPIVRYQGGWSWDALRRNRWPLLIMAIVGPFGFNIALLYGLRSTSSVNGALIMAFNPALTMLLAALLNGERINRQQLIGLVVGLAGVAIVVSKGSWQTLTALQISQGDLLVLLASLSWAVYSVIPKRFVSGLPTVQITAGTIILGALIMAVSAAFTMPDFFAWPSMPVLTAIMFMGMFGTVLAYLWWNQGVQIIGAAHTAVFANMVPIFAASIGILLGQPLSYSQLCGAILVISGVVYSSLQHGQWKVRAA